MMASSLSAGRGMPRSDLPRLNSGSRDPDVGVRRNGHIEPLPGRIDQGAPRPN
jgi:hypothetical protein